MICSHVSCASSAYNAQYSLFCLQHSVLSVHCLLYPIVFSSFPSPQPCILSTLSSWLCPLCFVSFVLCALYSLLCNRFVPSSVLFYVALLFLSSMYWFSSLSFPLYLIFSSALHFSGCPTMIYFMILYFLFSPLLFSLSSLPSFSLYTLL